MTVVENGQISSCKSARSSRSFALSLSPSGSYDSKDIQWTFLLNVMLEVVQLPFAPNVSSKKATESLKDVLQSNPVSAPVLHIL